MPAPVSLSVVVPVYDELGSLDQLYQELRRACDATGLSWEIWFVDDGSRDGSAERLEALADADPRIGVLHFRRNFGKSPALAAGFARARGELVITLDADLQDDPVHIPEFVERLRAGADLVSGWKRRRQDPLAKTLPSRVFNAVVRFTSGLALHDFNCGFKGYRRACVDELRVYGGLHRFLPVLAHARGFRVEELAVAHRPRAHGHSKFGARRLLDGMFDLLTVLLITRYRTSPLHFFALPGLGLAALGLGLASYLSIRWLAGAAIGARPLLTLSVLCLLAGLQLASLGLIAELVTRAQIDRAGELFSVRAERAPGRGAGAAPPSPASAPAGEERA